MANRLEKERIESPKLVVELYMPNLVVELKEGQNIKNGQLLTVDTDGQKYVPATTESTVFRVYLGEDISNSKAGKKIQVARRLRVNQKLFLEANETLRTELEKESMKIKLETFGIYLEEVI